MRGRKPKPTAVKRATGNPGKRSLPVDEPVPQSGMPDPPADLSVEALSVWQRVTPELMAMGVLATVHRELVASYCRAVAEEEEAERHIADEGQVISTMYGPKLNPWVRVRNESEKRKRSIAVEFGLTPSSQARASKVKAPPGGSDGEDGPALRLYKRANSRVQTA